MCKDLMLSPFFGLTISCAAWYVAVLINKKTKIAILNPLIVSAGLVILVLTVFNIPLSAYNVGGDFIKLMLSPATAVLALNIYRQRAVLKEYFLPIVCSCFVGSLVSVGAVLGLCKLFQMDSTLTASLLPKSVTTAIAVGIAESSGGIGGIAAAAVVITGIIGAVFAPLFAKIFFIKNPIAEGLAIGASSHALGTTKALEIGKVQGAMSSVAICVCGIMTAGIIMFFG